MYAVMIPGHKAALVLEYRERLSSGIMCFVKVGTGQEFRFNLSQWAEMRSDLRACRICASAGDGATIP
ncbi:hypothetical protein ACVWWG_004647 [Bradyrhizobium sp. LB7.2]